MMCLCFKTHRCELLLSPTQDGPHTSLPTLRIFPTLPLTPPPAPTHLIHLGLGLLQSPVTGEVWRRRRGASLPSRGGRGGSCCSSRPEGRDELRPRAWNLRPRSQGSAHTPVHPSVPLLHLPGRKAIRWEPGLSQAPPQISCVTLSERSPLNLRASVSHPVK